MDAEQRKVGATQWWEGGGEEEKEGRRGREREREGERGREREGGETESGSEGGKEHE